MPRALTSLLLLLCAASATAQDFYDINVLRTVNLSFSQPNYWSLTICP